MADFFFFCDYDLMNTQASSDAFNGTNIFSNHILDTHKNSSFIEEDHPQTTVFFGTQTGLGHRISGAYAVCDGRVFVFPESTAVNTGLSYNTSYAYWQQTVTIVLQPSQQPRNGIPPVKYYIYSGILLSSLVDNADKIAHDGRNATIINSNYNDLTRKILDALKTTTGTESFNNTLDKDYSLSQATDYVKKLDEIFFRDNATNQLFDVKGGDCIGYFNYRPYPDDQKISLGILFDAVGYHPTINQMRGPAESPLDYNVNYNYNNFDQTTNNPSALSDAKYYGVENIKLNYLDPCAFYGSFAYNAVDKLWARKFVDLFEVIPRTGATDNLPLKGRPIFTEQIFGPPSTPADKNMYLNVISKFYNKNAVYIDIRNPENKQLNFYTDYSPYAKLKVTNPATTGPHTAYVSLSNILANDPNNLKTCIRLDPTYFASSTGITSNDFEIALPDGKVTPFTVGTENYTDTVNETPSAYVDNIYRKGDFKEDLLGATKFVPNFKRSGNTNYSSTIKLSVKNYNSDLQQPISTYIRIYYLKESDIYTLPKTAICCDVSIPFPNPLLEPSPSVTKTLRSYEYLDNFFTPFQMIIPNLNPPPTPNGISSNIYYDPKYLDNTKAGGVRMMAYPGIAQDKSGRITLFAVPADVRTPARASIESGINVPGMIIGDGNNEMFIEHLSKTFPELGKYYKRVKLDKTDIGETTDREVEFVAYNKDVNLDTLKSVSAGTIAWLTIEKTDFDTLKNINNSRGNAPFGVFTADFVDPAKTYLGIKVIASGIAKDKNNGDAKIDFIKYEFILRNETYNASTTQTEFKEVHTGIYAYSVRVDGPEITNPKKFPKILAGTFPYFVTTNPYGGLRLQSTVYLLPDPNIRPEELWEFMQYVQCNIRQVWTNRNDINPDTSAQYNCGRHNVGLLYGQGNSPKIDAEQIIVKVGNAAQTEALGPGECAFNVKRKGVAVTVDRSYAVQGRFVGNLYYKPITPLGTGPRTWYAEDGDNTPAHEFGHLMGLSDRYTCTGVVNTTNNKMVGEFEGNKPMFMNDFLTFGTNQAFDPEFIKDYNWAYNLYSTQKMVFGAARTPTGPPPEAKLAQTLEQPAFDAFRDDNTGIDKIPANPSTGQIPTRYGRICAFITAKQWYVVENYTFETKLAETSGNPDIVRLFSNSEYVFFKAYNSSTPPTTTVDVSVIGLFFESPNYSAVSDLRYAANGNINPDGVMNLRIKQQPPALPTYGTNNKPNDNAIAGFFSPYISSPAGSSVFNRRAVESDPEMIEDIENSGLVTLEKILNDPTIANKKPAIKAAFPAYDGTSSTIYLTTLDPYKDFGDGNAVGRGVWNYANGKSKSNGLFTIYYNNCPFRRKIIERIQGVS